MWLYQQVKVAFKSMNYSKNIKSRYLNFYISSRKNTTKIYSNFCLTAILL
jgi:hypothetical protein